MEIVIIERKWSHYGRLSPSCAYDENRAARSSIPWAACWHLSMFDTLLMCIMFITDNVSCVCCETLCNAARYQSRALQFTSHGKPTLVAFKYRNSRLPSNIKHDLRSCSGARVRFTMSRQASCLMANLNNTFRKFFCWHRVDDCS